MDRRTAKREAWWRAARVVCDALHNGWDLSITYPDPAEARLVEEQLSMVIEEMERRGHK